MANPQMKFKLLNVSGFAVAAKLILECLDEGLYRARDAAKKVSLRSAEKPGYEFSREYVVCGAI